MEHQVSEILLADILGVSRATTQKWAESGQYPATKNERGEYMFAIDDLMCLPEIQDMTSGKWNEEFHVKPARTFTSVELFAGAGGLALGMAKAGFKHVLLNEFDHMACRTLRINHPEWNVSEEDVHDVDFTPLRDKVDFLSGGFPCQAFSYAGKKGGLNDTRGTLFFELARAVREIRPKVFMGENVKGLLSHEDGRTLDVIKSAIKELGYTLVEPRVLKAIMYQVPQKRERIILIAIRNDIAERVQFQWPAAFERVMTLRDAFYKGILFDTDVPSSPGQTYPEKKKQVLAQVPMGGDWRDLPVEVQKEYLGGSFYLGGGKTGMARRLSLDEPSLTLTCAPAQKQTERCHPLETRPLTVREYARIQTFPDSWLFAGNLTDQYKQIGNAVPVNLAYAIGRSLIRLFNDINEVMPEPSRYAEANRIGAKMVGAKQTELDFGNLFARYPEGISVNSAKLCESVAEYNQHLLIGLVKKDNETLFLEQKATIYYTGKRFPATIELNKLCYFSPFIKGKGIRDLYTIKAVRVGTRKEGQKGNSPTDFRLVFEIEFARQMFADYKMIKPDIWRTYRDTYLADVANGE